MKKGQSLIELVVALGVGAAMMGVAISGLFLVLRGNQLAQQNQSASVLIESLANLVIPFAEKKWHNVYDLDKGPANHYFIATSTGQLVAQTGNQQLSAGETYFTRYFYVENVSRDNNGKGNIETVYDPSNDDPSTQKITFVSNWIIGGSNNALSLILYLTRWPNEVFQQSDWSGGPGQTGPITSLNNKFEAQSGLNYAGTPGSIFPALASCDGCELTSSIIDTGVTGGVTFNTIMWQGNLGSGNVKFKFASSNCPNGENDYPTCASGSWDWNSQSLRPAGPNIQEFIPRVQGANYRYFKLRIIVDSNNLSFPEINEVIVNWSR